MLARSTGHRRGMVPGIVLLILGGFFLFALEAGSSWLDTDAFGLVLALGGLAFVGRALLKARVARRTHDTHVERQL